MTDYNTLKVPELKKLLGDRSLPISGNKADLIARLQEDDKKPTNTKAAASAPTAEDEIDWDEDDAKATTASAAAAIAAGGQGPVTNPVAVPNQKLHEDPAKTSDLKTVGEKEATAAAASTKATTEASITEPAKDLGVEEAPKQDFTLGIGKTDAEKEAEKRAARARRFGLAEDVEEKRKLERAKKFGTGEAEIAKGLDEALPERKAKRGRKGEEQEGRAAKRQTPDRRTEGAPAKVAASKGSSAKATAAKATPTQAKKIAGRVTDDPAEKAKAEARAKRFQTTA